VDTLDGSAAFEIHSDSLGVLIPRLSAEIIGAINKPTESLLVYQADSVKGYRYYDGDRWVSPSKVL